MVKDHPELITAAQVDYIFASLQTYTSKYNETNIIFQMLGSLASAQPHLFDRHRETLSGIVVEKQSIDAWICLQQYYIASTVIGGERAADAYLTQLLDLVKTNNKLSNDLKTLIFSTCQTIGMKYKHSLAKKRSDLLAFESNSACRILIDIIDGNQLSEENQASINRAHDDIVQIEQRVVHTEREIQNVTKVVKRQELSVSYSMYLVDTPAHYERRDNGRDPSKFLPLCRRGSVSSIP